MILYIYQPQRWMQPKRDIDRPALLVELKWDKTADGTPRQIKDKKYASWVEGYTGEILLVGINYDLKLPTPVGVLNLEKSIL